MRRTSAMPHSVQDLMIRALLVVVLAGAAHGQIIVRENPDGTRTFIYPDGMMITFCPNPKRPCS
jgi:hypothetical protein